MKNSFAQYIKVNGWTIAVIIKLFPLLTFYQKIIRGNFTIVIWNNIVIFITNFTWNFILTKT
jgi:hypothetical protein